MNLSQSSPALDNSLAVRSLRPVFKAVGRNGPYYLANSRVANMVTAAAPDPGPGVLKGVSVVIIALITVNAALSILTGRDIGLYGWIVRGGFLFAGLAGLSCRAGWSDIKDTSLIFKLIS